LQLKKDKVPDTKATPSGTEPKPAQPKNADAKKRKKKLKTIASSFQLSLRLLHLLPKKRTPTTY